MSFCVIRDSLFPHIVDLADKDGRLFHIALSYQDSVVYENKDTRVVFDGRWHYSGYQAEQLCIHLSNMESHKQYCVDYDYLSQFLPGRKLQVSMKIW